MQRARIAVALVTLLATSSMVPGAETAPGDVRFDDGAVVTPVADGAGDPEAGAKVFVDRSLGNCLACHAVSTLEKEQFHGTVGPSLDGVADRWSVEQLRAIVVDAKKVFGDQTVMPGFYSLNVGLNVRKDLAGKTVLSAQQVEDVVAFLGTLGEAQ